MQTRGKRQQRGSVAADTSARQPECTVVHIAGICREEPRPFGTWMLRILARRPLALAAAAPLCCPQCPGGRRLPADSHGMWHVAQSSIGCVVTGCMLGSAAAADGLWAPRQSGWQRYDEQQGRKHCGIKRQGKHGKICVERISLRLRNLDPCGWCEETQHLRISHSSNFT